MRNVSNAASTEAMLVVVTKHSTSISVQTYFLFSEALLSILNDN